MKTNLAQTAIKFAVNGQWTEALETNRQILEIDPKDVDALNRMARCYSELGDAVNAKSTVKKVLSIDPENQIALKCLSKYQNLKNGNKRISDINSSDAFLEEPGKTRIIDLLNLGDKSVISTLETADLLKVTCHAHKVSIVTNDDKYVGRLPDDIAVRIRNCMKSGNTYSVLVKSVSANGVVVFIREVVNKTKNPTFPPEKIDYISYALPTQNLEANF